MRETELRDPVAAWLVERVNGAVIADEVDLGWASPDLVAAEPRHLEVRATPGPVSPMVLTSAQVWALYDLDVPKCRDDLRVASSSSWTRYRVDVLEPLANSGLLECGEEDVWTRLREPDEAFDPMIAVELKIRDWRRAIHQASQYRAFVRSSYIAMPAGNVTAACVDAARARGVGVLAVLSDEVDCVLEAPQEDPLDARVRTLVSEIVLAGYLGLREHRPAGSPGGAPMLVAS